MQWVWVEGSAEEASYLLHSVAGLRILSEGYQALLFRAFFRWRSVNLNCKVWIFCCQSSYIFSRWFLGVGSWLKLLYKKSRIPFMTRQVQLPAKFWRSVLFWIIVTSQRGRGGFSRLQVNANREDADKCNVEQLYCLQSSAAAQFHSDDYTIDRLIKDVIGRYNNDSFPLSLKNLFYTYAKSRSKWLTQRKFEFKDDCWIYCLITWIFEKEANKTSKLACSCMQPILLWIVTSNILHLPMLSNRGIPCLSPNETFF